MVIPRMQLVFTFVAAWLTLGPALAFDAAPDTARVGEADDPFLHRSEQPRRRVTAFEFAAIRAMPNDYAPAMADRDRRELIQTAGDGRLAEVKTLLAAGANANAVDAPGERPLAVAATAGHAEIVRLLLQHGADPGRVDKEARPPLWRAISHSQDLGIRLLRAHGAGPGAMSTAMFD